MLFFFSWIFGVNWGMSSSRSHKIQTTCADWVIDSPTLHPLLSDHFQMMMLTHVLDCIPSKAENKEFGYSLFGGDPRKLPETAGWWGGKGREVNKTPKKHCSAGRCGQLRPNATLGPSKGHKEKWSLFRWGRYSIYPPVNVLLITWSPSAVLPACPFISPGQKMPPGRKGQEGRGKGEPFPGVVWVGSLPSPFF